MKINKEYRPRWADEELDRLYTYCQTHDYLDRVELSKLFPDRTVVATLGKINRLKLHKQMRGRHWNKANDEYLLKAINLISQKLNVTPDSVMRRAGQIWRANHK